MPIKIHHGPPGTYKTSGAMGDDFLREARAGRTIITNVRGVSRERTFKAFDDLPSSFEVIWIDDQTDEGREKLRKWFHWAPKGAFLFIDEAQDIWPRSWRDSDLRAFDYPGGREAAKRDDRPVDWAQAWDKHRHWNWDLVLTTPDIKKVREDIRGVADGAYKHKDLALIGWPGRYVEGFHSPDDSGTSNAHFYSITQKKVPAYVWKLYDSTSTGFFSFTKSGSSLYKNPRILFLLAIIVGGVAFAFRDGAPTGILSPNLAFAQPASSASRPAVPLPSQAPTLPPAAPPDRALPRALNVQADSVPADVIPFTDGDAVIKGTSVIKGKHRYHIDMGDAYVTSDDFIKAGYLMIPMGDCAVKFFHGNYTRIIRCGRQNPIVQPSPSPDTKKPLIEPLQLASKP